jgi:hypothetical protein
LILLLQKKPLCGTLGSGKGAKAKGSGNTRELELNPADGSSHKRNHVMATTPTKKKPKKKMTKTS